jgi:hypothetical protein
VSKLRTLAAIVLLTLITTTASAARVPPGDDGGPSIIDRVWRAVVMVMHVLDDSKLSPPIP